MQLSNLRGASHDKLIAAFGEVPDRVEIVHGWQAQQCGVDLWAAASK
jgi:hypothetical protein